MNLSELKEFQPKSILVIQLRQMGDLLLSTPAIRMLRKRYPESELCVLVDEIFEQIFILNPHINALIKRKPNSSIIESINTIRQVRRKKFDLIIDFLANPRTALISLLSRAKLTVSYANRSRSFIYKLKVKPYGDYVAVEKQSLLIPLGIEPEKEPELDFFLADSGIKTVDEFLSGLNVNSEDFLVVIDPFHKRKSREWKPEYFLEIADWLSRRFKAKVIFSYAPQNQERAKNLILKGREKHYLSFKTDLFELGALIRRAKLFIGNDGGPRHIAVSQKTPSFVVLGPSGNQWTHPSDIHRTISLNLACSPCDYHICPFEGHPCLLELKPEIVKDELEKFIQTIIIK